MDITSPTRTNQGAALSREAARAAAAGSTPERDGVEATGGTRSSRAEDLAARAASERARRAPSPAEREARDARMRLEEERRVERARAEETQLEQRRAEQASLVPDSTLAVRTGPAPVADPVGHAADQALRDSLNEHARLVSLDLEPVMAMPDDGGDEAGAPEVDLMGDGSSDPADVELMGDGSRPAEMPPLMGEGREQRVDETTAPRRPFEREVERPDVQRAGASVPEIATPDGAELAQSVIEEQRSDEPEHGERAAAVAPQAAPLPTSGEPEARSSATDTPEERRAGEAAARAGLTLGGVVEAETGDAIVTRFIDGLPASSSGPEPSPAEHLGQRSAPPRD